MTPWERIRRRGLQRWLPTYLAEAPARLAARSARRGTTTHLIFLVCDHFEPRHAARDDAQVIARLRAWSDGFASLQRWCASEFGTRPLHTWFYPPHHGRETFPHLSRWVHDGLGEAELHYHHDGDTEETFRGALGACLRDYARHGLLLESGEQPRTRFGFIHGDWALDNSCGGRFCGVNGELSILAEHGCWGDFTMPSGNECQTRKINSIYYAIDSRDRSMSHNWGRDARVGVKDPPGFFLMQGPLGLRWQRPWRPRIENASLTSANWGSPERIRSWIDCHVHVRGRPDWLFIKLHTHGAIERDFDALFGERARKMHRLLNTEYNDGRNWRLHYVTARQAFNIAKAAEHGLDGDPQDHLDYIVKEPALRHYLVDAEHDLLRCSARQLRLRVDGATGPVHAQARIGPVSNMDGTWREISADADAAVLRISGDGNSAPWRARLRAAPGFSFESGPGLEHSGDGWVEFAAPAGATAWVEASPTGKLTVRTTPRQPQEQPTHESV